MPDRRMQTLFEHTKPRSQAALKRLLGELPLAAEAYWQLRQRGGAPIKSFSMHRIEKKLPELVAQAETACRKNKLNDKGYNRRRVLIFVTLRYWIEHGALLGLALAGLGHQVTLLFLPFTRWDQTPSRFDARRLNAYAQKVLSQASPFIKPVSLLDIAHSYTVTENRQALAKEIAESIQEVSLRDTQYSLQIEEVDRDNQGTPSGNLFHLRQERNLLAARAVMDWLTAMPNPQRPELVLTPNGSILEMGAVYQLARFLEIPAVTYEFGEQRGRIWVAQNAEVMRQETDGLWGNLEDTPLSQEQWERMRALYSSRQNASLWETFGRLWQGLPLQGGDEVRQILNLDSRPVGLLAANVIGDSLTLGRQIFSQNMTEWLKHTVQLFTTRPDIQWVIRIHPGERYTRGPSVAEVVRSALPVIPGHIHLVQAPDPVNTYDLIEIADLGLVYTTTVGMEMAMSGVPVIVSGATHYRGKGFTLDPASWQEFDRRIQAVLDEPKGQRLSPGQIEKAWHYAYRFYFDFPCPFPWHLLDFAETLNDWPIDRALSGEGLEQFGRTYRYLAGEPRDWKYEAG